jgi:hypothetical protein
MTTLIDCPVDEAGGSLAFSLAAGVNFGDVSDLGLDSDVFNLLSRRESLLCLTRAVSVERARGSGSWFVRKACAELFGAVVSCSDTVSDFLSEPVTAITVEMPMTIKTAAAAIRTDL